MKCSQFKMTCDQSFIGFCRTCNLSVWFNLKQEARKQRNIRKSLIIRQVTFFRITVQKNNGSSTIYKNSISQKMVSSKIRYPIERGQRGVTNVFIKQYPDLCNFPLPVGTFENCGRSGRCPRISDYYLNRTEKIYCPLGCTLIELRLAVWRRP